MLSRIKAALRRFHALAALTVILLMWLGASGRWHCLLPFGSHPLYCAVNANAGFAHLTRGMNTATIAALDAAAGPQDMPLLEEMLLGEDRIAAMTAAEVLRKRGPKGRDILKKAFDAVKSGDTSRAMLINEYGELGEKLQ
jgi:hypothetical protein